jgi:hypothetical protein
MASKSRAGIDVNQSRNACGPATTIAGGKGGGGKGGGGHSDG